MEETNVVIEPKVGLPWVEPVLNLEGWEKEHGSLQDDFAVARFNPIPFTSKTKKTKMITLQGIDDEENLHATLQGHFTAYAMSHPESKLVEVWMEGEAKKWRVNTDIPFGRKNGSFIEN